MANKKSPKAVVVLAIPGVMLGAAAGAFIGALAGNTSLGAEVGAAAGGGIPLVAAATVLGHHFRNSIPFFDIESNKIPDKIPVLSQEHGQKNFHALTAGRTVYAKAAYNGNPYDTSVEVQDGTEFAAASEYIPSTIGWEGGQKIHVQQDLNNNVKFIQGDKELATGIDISNDPRLQNLAKRLYTSYPVLVITNKNPLQICKIRQEDIADQLPLKLAANYDPENMRFHRVKLSEFFKPMVQELNEMGPGNSESRQSDRALDVTQKKLINAFPPNATLQMSVTLREDADFHFVKDDGSISVAFRPSDSTFLRAINHGQEPENIRKAFEVRKNFTKLITGNNIFIVKTDDHGIIQSVEPEKTRSVESVAAPETSMNIEPAVQGPAKAHRPPSR